MEKLLKEKLKFFQEESEKAETRLREIEYTEDVQLFEEIEELEKQIAAHIACIELITELLNSKQ